MIFAIIANLLLTSCASFSFARKCPCEDVVLLPRPNIESCIANSDGTMLCNGQYFPVENNICRSPQSDSSLFIWIDHAIRQVGQ